MTWVFLGGMLGLFTYLLAVYAAMESHTSGAPMAAQEVPRTNPLTLSKSPELGEAS